MFVKSGRPIWFYYYSVLIFAPGAGQYNISGDVGSSRLMVEMSILSYVCIMSLTVLLILIDDPEDCV